VVRGDRIDIMLRKLVLKMVLCVVVGCCISGVEPLCSVTRELDS
jgi:hypothetical protein